ncbi:DUF5672 family protein [Riemerella anatipestifer]|uniref:DUF5672 family protein n=1 Tax=Riemerella anatipestifer TaxID=34085 RepID=A0AAP6LM01_RIEAN|nr:DUF5672 family protein [Riemerella anatipestifer]MBT0549369.1 hypothetical protein [Riemerella anatipestifer]MBT0555930.1 hypothetical protein [Riemerella anatipestifer]MBT0560132.1 hypothetical protein [Riemerella anatipestifer]MCD5968641.1 hypothetical protein [Riemerella anatipestifer]MCO7355094.1 hypothetical protein [Riemerella anatipestifer]
MVTIIIPIYKEKPTLLEMVSIEQTFKVLDGYDIAFVCPKTLDISYYRKHYPKARFKCFAKCYFDGIYGYNQLMLSEDFYQFFETKYILICQPDAFLFKNDLEKWLLEDYDYVGAPWLRSSDRIPILKKIWDFGLSFIKQVINYKENGKWQKNKSLLYNQVGNGGLSLRKREKCIEVLKQLSEVVSVYLKPSNRSSFYAEDVFFSVEPQRNGLSFRKPDCKKACGFAIENKQKKALAFNEGELPFGCHRWDKELNFWKKYIEQEGYKLE